MRKSSIDRFLHRLASSDPTPGGGSAAALSGALGCALGAMVGRILLSRPRVGAAERRALKREVVSLDGIRRCLERLIDRDARAYQALVSAQRTGRSLGRARAEAIGCPLAICRESTAALGLLKRVGRRTGPYLGSDIRAGRALLKGAFEAAAEMVEINRKG